MKDESNKVKDMIDALRDKHPRGNLNGIYRIYFNKYFKFFGISWGYLEVYTTSKGENLTLFVRSGFDSHNSVMSGIEAAFVDINIESSKFVQFYKVALSVWLERVPSNQELLRQRFYDLVINRELVYVKYSDLEKA